MKALNPFSFCVMLISCLSSSFVSAQSSGSTAYNITEGHVVITPARCINNTCAPLAVTLTGTFVGFVSGKGSQLFFTSSAVSTKPDVGFELPQDPNEDSNGTNREATFVVSGDTIKVNGSIDSRAFDGPLINYSLVAKINTTVGSSYFTARPDFRKCASPMCGGYFVKSVNKKLTTCADGKRLAECYVAAINYGASALTSDASFSNNAPILLLGTVNTQTFANMGKFGVFSAKMAYQSATQTSTNTTFFSIEDNGIRCITTPCFSYDQNVVNSNAPTTRLSNMNLNKVGASASAIEQASQLLADGESLFAAGSNRIVKGMTGNGVEFVAQQFYLPIKPAAIDCEKGYVFADGACRTPYGCKFPDLELTGYGGAAFVDPVTGEIKSSISKSCVTACDAPAMLSEPGQCKVYYP